MNLNSSLDYLKKEIKRLDIPYFNCLVKKNGKIVFAYRYSKNHNNNNLMCLYSMAKPITVVAMLQLVEKGLIKINDKVSKYLDGYSYGFAKEIKIHHLLTMTSGLDYNLSRKAIVDLLKHNPEATTIEVVSKFATDGLCFKPGEKFNYSLSMDVCAAIISKVTGMKFSQYVKRNIFNRLKMKDSTFKNDYALANKSINEYALDSNNVLRKAKRFYSMFLINHTYESGGAGLIGTIEDYIKFIDSLTVGDEKLIKNKILDQMTKIYVDKTPFNKTNHDYSKSSDEYGYGYGVRVRKVESVNRVPVGEFGWDSATGSYCLSDRKNKISIVFGMNIQAWPFYLNDFHIKLVNQIYQDLKI